MPDDPIGRVRCHHPNCHVYPSFEQMIYHIDPTAKVRQTQSDKWKQRPCVMRYRAFADKLRGLVATLQDGDSVIFWIDMPKSWSEKKRSKMAGALHTSRPDLDNLLGGLMDAVMPKGDSHLASLSKVEKRWGTTGRIQIDRRLTLLDQPEKCPP